MKGRCQKHIITIRLGVYFFFLLFAPLKLISRFIPLSYFSSFVILDPDLFGYVKDVYLFDMQSYGTQQQNVCDAQYRMEKKVFLYYICMNSS